MILAELLVRHTRRHMPTRRVALGSAYLPMSGSAHGRLLLGALVHLHRDALDDEELELVPQILHRAARGLDVPSIAWRYRLQTDTHGLDRSRHRVVEEGGLVIVELDVHGGAVPQLLGALLGAASLPPSPRVVAVDTLRSAFAGRFRYPANVRIRRLELGLAPETPWSPTTQWKQGGPASELGWEGVPSDRRWAMEVFGFRVGVELDRDEVNRRFRRLLRDAHPDSGGSRDHAAERIAELSEARELLLVDLVEAESVAAADASAGASGGE